MRRLLKNRNFLVTVLSLTVLVLAIQWRIGNPDTLKSLRNITFDTYQRIKPRTPDPTPVIIVDIDNSSLAEFGQWPWPRTRMARMVEQLSDMGAAAIAFDIVFAEPDRTTGSEIIRQLDEISWPDREKLQPVLDNLPDNDQIFAESIGKAPVILGFFSLPSNNDQITPNTMPQSLGTFVFGGEDPKPALLEVKNSISPLVNLQKQASGIGVANPSPQKNDDIVRQVPLFVDDGSTIYPSLALETLRVAQGASTFIIKTTSASGEISAGELAVTEAKIGDFALPLTANGSFNIYFAPEQAARTISAREIINSDIDAMGAKIEGKIVFVGTSAAGLEDLRVSALGQSIPGVSIHAQIVDQILTGNFLRRPDWATGAEIALTAIIGLLIIVGLPFLGAIASALIGAALATATVAISWIGFSQNGLLIDPVYPTLVTVGIFLLTIILRFVISEREKRFVRSAFQQYLAPDLLNKLEQNPESLKLGGEIRDLTLMFMDMRGFTPISEKLTPQELVTFLNKLLSPLSEIIQKHEGAIDKYIGDCIMAFWNAPLDVEMHPRKSALAALEMLECIHQLNDDDAFGFKARGLDLPDIEIGIGLNSGDGCVGNVGSLERFDYSVVGDTVNVASRIESAGKEIGWPLLVSEETAKNCPGFAMLKAGMVDLKGKSLPLALYALIGDEEFAKSDYFTQLAKLHNELITALEDRGWKKGGKDMVAKINKCRDHANNNLAKFYNHIEVAYG